MLCVTSHTFSLALVIILPPLHTLYLPQEEYRHIDKVQELLWASY